MTLSEKRKALAACSLFAGISEECLARAADSAQEAVFSPGELLFSKENRRLGVIALGSAKATKPGKNGPVTMSVLGYGAVFGAASIMGGDLPGTEARAIRQVTALVFDPDSFIRLIESDRELNANYIRYLISRIRFLTERVECMAGSSASEKLLRYLETNARDSVCHIPFGMDALAKGISMSRATLYRAMSELEKNGRITRSGHEIRLL